MRRTIRATQWRFPATSRPMPFLRRLPLAALFAGVLSGVPAAALHQLATVPLILEAEKYEHAPAAVRARPCHPLIIVEVEQASCHKRLLPSQVGLRAGYLAWNCVRTGMGRGVTRVWTSIFMSLAASANDGPCWV